MAKEPTTTCHKTPPSGSRHMIPVSVKRKARPHHRWRKSIEAGGGKKRVTPKKKEMRIWHNNRSTSLIGGLRRNLERPVAVVAQMNKASKRKMTRRASDIYSGVGGGSNYSHFKKGGQFILYFWGGNDLQETKNQGGEGLY